MGLFDFFKGNSVIGKATAFNRNYEENTLVLNIAANDGSGTYVFTAYEPLASEIEGILFTHRQKQETVNLKIEYASDGQTVTKITVVRIP